MKAVSVAIVSLIVYLLSCNSMNTNDTFDRLWTDLKSARDSSQEASRVDELRRFFIEIEGSYTIYATQQNKQVNVLDSTYRYQPTDQFSINSSIDDVQLNGTGWLPKDPDNVSRFFLE